jgi:hypothetical protein
MRFPTFSLIALFSVSTLSAASTTAETAPPQAQTPPAVSFQAGDLPLVLPGYRLEELDVKKPCVLRVGSKVIELRIPVFVYFPAEAQSRTEALKGLHDVYNAIVDLSAKQNIAPSDFKEALEKLDAALTALEAVPPPGMQAPKTGNPPVNADGHEGEKAKGVASDQNPKAASS